MIIQRMFSCSLLALVVGPLTLTACSSGGGSSPSTNNQAAGTGPNTSASLVGNWAQSCAPTTSSGSTTSLLNFTTTNMTMTATVYLSSDCSGSSLATVAASGAYTVGSAASGVANATNIAFAFNPTAQVTPTSSVAALAMNQEAFCGISNWTSGAAEAVSATNTCLGIPSSDLSPNQIFEISGNVLYFGNANNTAIVTTAGFTKQ